MEQEQRQGRSGGRGGLSGGGGGGRFFGEGEEGNTMDRTMDG